MLLTMKEMLAVAREHRFSVGAFNICDSLLMKTVIETAEENDSPVIVELAPPEFDYVGEEFFKYVVERLEKSSVPAVLHLDHGSYDGAKACIEAGFTSVMFDGSHYPFEENLEKSKEMIALAHAKGCSIECEVGGIGGEEDGVTSMGELADPKECETIAGLGVDFLAAGIGNIHGKYPSDWAGLNFDRLGEIQDITNGKPLVLHGGSGIPADQIAKAISLGVSKINVNTELQLEFAAATRKYIEAGKDQEGKGYDPRKLLKPGADAIKAKVIAMMEQFGSAGKA